MILVSDTTPISELAKVGYLTILDGMIKHETSIGERWYMQALILSQENQ